MNTVAVLVASGVEEIEIPCLIFASIEEGLKYVRPLLGFPTISYDGDESRSPRFEWEFHAEQFDKIESEAERRAGERAYTQPFFNRYFAGGGDCLTMTLREVPFATAFVNWDFGR